VKVLAVSGSLRADSYNTRLLEAAAAAGPVGVEVDILDPALIADLPLYDQDLEDEGAPASVDLLRDAWAGSDAILFATPEYNGSVPGGLKNAIDWASRPKFESALTNKTVSVIGASTGQFGAMWAQQDLRKILGIAGARVVGEGLPVARAHEGLPDLLHEQLRDVLQTLAEAVAPDPVPAEKRGRPVSDTAAAPDPVTSLV
jgi:chromate reductase, NAD(P)H dehydrogenase (quinone)